MRRIWLLCEDDGGCEMAGFFESLEPGTLRRIIARLDRTDRVGVTGNPEQYRVLDPPLCEFKVHSPQAIRVYAFATGRGWILCFGEKKAKPHVTQRRIDRLRALYQRFNDEGARYA
ncbi:MAG: hypothetical protein Q8S43_03985 [Actinomycetota bacterium]|nr:hypothetical protein [Actinomycetota bacterium]